MVGRVISVPYPAAEVLLLALVARLLVGAGVRNTAFQLLAASLLVMLAGDVGFAVLAQADAFTPNNTSSSPAPTTPSTKPKRPAATGYWQPAPQRAPAASSRTQLAWRG